MKKIREVMTTNVHTIGLEQTVEKAKQLMSEHQVRHLPVRSGGELIGILSDRDISYAMAVEKKKESDLTIEDVFLTDLYMVEPDTPVSDVAATMAKEGYGSVLIVDNDQLQGIFTTIDACKLLSQQA